jgi:hypothetical protein
MSYTCVCVVCGDRYNGGSLEEELLSNPEYTYDPTNFECTPCKYALAEAESEMVADAIAEEADAVQRLMEEEWLEEKAREAETDEY